MKQPISKVFSCYSQWLSKRKSHFKSQNKSIRSCCKMGFYEPSGKSARMIGGRFDVKEPERCYVQTLNGQGLTCDIIDARFQASAMKGNERAFNLRWSTVPRILTHGYNANYVEVNGLYKKYMTDKVNWFINLGKKNRKTKEK